MANKKITDLTELTAAASNDYLEIVDTSANTSKKISRENLIAGHDHGSLSGLGDNDHPQYVLMSGNQTVAGTKTFSSFPVTPSSAPTTNYQVSNKKYVDDLIGAWQSYTVSWTAGTTNPSIGNGTLSGRYIQIGKLVYCQFTMRAGSTTTFGSGNWRFSYPVAPNTTYANLYQVGSIYALDNDAANYNGITQYTGTTYMGLIISGNWVSATAPFTWANGDVLEVNVIYEAA